MKQEGSTKVSAAKTSISEDEKCRKSLHVLQPAAMDKENLVGAGRTLRSTVSAKETVKYEMSGKTKNEMVKRKKITCRDKAVQTDRGEKIKIKPEDLTSEAGPSENYWEVLAKRRQIALDDALDENKKLTERIAAILLQNATLEEENHVYKEMLDESRALVEVLQEMIGEDNSTINNSLDDSVL